jgi:SAM-dependent methyltransferase
MSQIGTSVRTLPASALRQLRSRLPRLYYPRRQALYNPNENLLVTRRQSVFDPTIFGTYDLSTHRVVPLDSSDRGVLGLGFDEVSARARAFVNSCDRVVVTSDRYEQVLALLQPGTGIVLDASVSHVDANVRRSVERLGYEYAPIGIEGDGVAVRREDVRKLTLADGSISRIISLDTLEHVERYEEGLREFHRVLEHGGVLFTHVPCYFTEREASVPIDPALDPWGHVRYFSARELLSQLMLTGLVILRASFQLDYGAALIVAAKADRSST